MRLGLYLAAVIDHLSKKRPIDQNAGILIIQICQKFLFCSASAIDQQ